MFNTYIYLTYKKSTYIYHRKRAIVFHICLYYNYVNPVFLTCVELIFNTS